MALEKAVDFIFPGGKKSNISFPSVMWEWKVLARCGCAISGSNGQRSLKYKRSVSQHVILDPASCRLDLKPQPATQEEETLPKGWQLDAISQRTRTKAATHLHAFSSGFFH